MQKAQQSQQINMHLPLGPKPVVFRVSMFDGCRDKYPKAKKASWARVCEVLTNHQPGEKDGAAISPSIFDGTRANENVTATSLAVFDVDGGSSFDAVLNAAKTAGLAVVLYTSYSHGDPAKPGDRFRVVVALSREVLPAEFPAIRNAVALALGIQPDPATKARAQIYYLPRHHTDRKHVARAEVVEGQAVDVDALLATLGDALLAVTAPSKGSATNADLSAGFEYAQKSADEVRQMLTCIPPTLKRLEGYLTTVWGVRAALGDEGLPLVLAWARGDLHPDQPRPEKWKGDDDVCGDWDSDTGKGSGVGSLVRLARQHGYQQPVATSVSQANGETVKPAGAYIRADTGNAARFVDVNGHRLRVLAGAVWMAWTGSRWKQDTAIAMQCAVALARDMLDEAVKIDDESARKAAVQHALATNSAGRLEAMLKIAATDPRLLVAGEQLDADEFGINTPAGYVDLKSGRVLLHDPTQLCTKITNVGPDWAMPTPVFDGFMSTIFDGNDELIEYGLRLMGYILTGSTREQILAFLHGTGCNGKSTLVELLAHIMGSYAAPIDTGLLMESRTPAGGANPELLRLRGLRLAFATETSDGAAFAESRLKWLTGGDTLTARDLYAAPVSWKPSHKLLLSGNYRPAIRGQDHGIWRRIHLVPFSVQIEEGQRDAELPAKLRAEAPGILAKLIDACGRWLRDGLKTPAAVKGATAAYRDESDSIGEFLAECCECSPDAVAPMAQVYPNYRMWATRNGITPLGGRRFGALLDERGYPSEKGTGGARLRRGLRLRITALHL